MQHNTDNELKKDKLHVTPFRKYVYCAHNKKQKPDKIERSKMWLYGVTLQQ